MNCEPHSQTAESLLEETKLTLGNLPYAIDAAKNRRTLATENVDRKEKAGAAIAGRVLREARSELSATENGLAELEARLPTLEAQVAALERKRAALSQQLELMTEQKRAVAAAEGSLAAAKARRDQAQLAVDVATLNLDRMVIRAPISGRVLTVDARPGKALTGLDPLAVQNSSASCKSLRSQQVCKSEWTCDWRMYLRCLSDSLLPLKLLRMERQ